MCRMLFRLGSALFLFLACLLLVSGQDLKIRPDQKYLILSTKKIGTMEKELGAAAKMGFRVLTG